MTYTAAIERALSQAIAGAELEAVLESVGGDDLVWSLGPGAPSSPR
ncbi:MAG TPA: hypothetical protein VLH75_13545 [Longimicrobiales bacterium]|nr:hypothetical protein [Longimicrobiales bacterium]